MAAAVGIQVVGDQGQHAERKGVDGFADVKTQSRF